MTTRPVFSVITVTYNNIDGLTRTGDSIALQSSSDFEWIIIDGGSTDGTKDYLQSVSAQSVSEKDSGIYDAMNKGIDRSHGDYVIFMNAGDVFSDADILGTLQKAITAENPDFIYTDALETGGFYKKARSHEQSNWGMFTHHQAMVYKRGLIGSLRYDQSKKIAADYDFTMRFLKNARNIHYIPCAMCIFEEGGISQQKKRLGRVEQFHARRAFKIPAWKNMLIYGVQTCSATLRDNFPALYKKLR